MRHRSGASLASEIALGVKGKYMVGAILFDRFYKINGWGRFIHLYLQINGWSRCIHSFLQINDWRCFIHLFLQNKWLAPFYSFVVTK